MCKISEFIKKFEGDSIIFKPSKNFYTSTNIKQKRWGKLYRGEAKPTFDELLKLAEFFHVDIKELANNI